ncbi:hypothetical protein DMB44_03705 [Thermoplasma sp. Kam2015]|uniref:hypothetical protein n=1 Tax=Thermoplasma sp. Kam2015 TaxID=2094122 RepID=UPI000D87ABD2|nr:hypothetical protein [Thermoplasma sp. Kam2015]PYB68456.1 hypothetical protein DMB44_03705 [Thermoplasma sp. Kam2015]
MAIPTKIMNMSRRRCPIEKSNESVFFSLVDYRNNYFMSDDPDKIIEFYEGFENRDQLIQWMKERPKGASYIHEVEGDKDIIVVIPTADFNGKYAKTCREEIFKGLHMVFIESGEIPDPYFNYSHSVNVGVKKAMEYEPKWIIVSNDDMEKIDDISILIKDLRDIDPVEVKTVYIASSEYHSTKRIIIKKRFLYSHIILLKRLILNGRELHELTKRRIKLEKKFYCSYIIAPENLIYKVLGRVVGSMIVGMSFWIFGKVLISEYNGSIFDETFINDSEDIDLSFRLSSRNLKYGRSSYRIGDRIGSSLGSYRNKKLNMIGFGINSKNMLSGVIREFRSIASVVYLNSKDFKGL